jgi:Holliday junction DNA helicase RuvA
MIGYLKGEVLSSDGKKVLLKTEFGIGYEVNYAYYADVGVDLEIYTHHHFTDSDQSLWGFNSLEDKSVFELLKSVNKVGASKAYVLLTQIGKENIINALTFEQVDVLTQASGIGKKMAEQIILSLKDKVDKIQVVSTQTSGQVKQQSDAGTTLDKSIVREALEALESLGYKDKDVNKIIRENMSSQVVSSEELIKIVLREL